ncbi:hypothetical protein [Gracilinema caldarium]|uniref:hypothetical protein n=1 Tax=Gracilinema caldarium TaxID=215591 RepID=UPI0026EA50C5|nr:hypothetical protein [Gracilinema caldarium]
MKKILYVLAAAVALFAIAGCSTGMHDGTQMNVTTVTITGLDSYTGYTYEGKTLVINGPFNGWSAWTTAACPSAVVSNGSATFTINEIISDPQFEFLIAPRTPESTGDYDCDWAYKIGVKVNGDNVKMDNKWTGPVTEQKIKGTMSANGDISWDYE